MEKAVTDLCVCQNMLVNLSKVNERLVGACARVVNRLDGIKKERANVVR